MSERFKEINNAEVGKRIRDLREKRDITREKLGELLEISDKTMRNIESGIYGTKLSNLYNIAQYFDVGLDYLVDGYNHSSYISGQVTRDIDGNANRLKSRKLLETELMELADGLNDVQLSNLLDAVSSMMKMTK